MANLNIFCVTNKRVKLLEDTKYILAWVGKDEAPNEKYISCYDGNNIFYKEKFYSELTFHYWYWKNLLDKRSRDWIGFCQKRRFWVTCNKNNVKIDYNNLKNFLLYEPEEDWENYESIICKPINVFGAKKIKILKRGWKHLLRNPSALFDPVKQNIKLHFDMHHGFGNLDIAAEEMNERDKEDFKIFIKNENSFNPHIMFISKPVIISRWFEDLFTWLERCEKKLGFNKIENYGTTRMYAYLAERYLSFWFKKYTLYKEKSWIQLDNL